MFLSFFLTHKLSSVPSLINLINGFSQYGALVVSLAEEEKDKPTSDDKELEDKPTAEDKGVGGKSTSEDKGVGVKTPKKCTYITEINLISLQY